MRAVRIHAWAQPPILDEVERPIPADGEALVRVEAAAVSHLDLTVASGDFGLRPQLPYTGGVEACGIVEESEEHAPGTRVLLRGGGLGVKRDGTWAEYVVARNRNLMPVPDGLDPVLAATYFVPTTTAHTALYSIGRLGNWSIEDVHSAEEEVVVVGGAAGAVGSIVAQLALLAGSRVIGLVFDDEQAASLPAGVEALVRGDNETEARLAAERGATLLVDTLGGPKLSERTSWVRPGGRAVVIGYVAGTDVTLDLPNWLLDDVALLPVNMIRRDRPSMAVAPELAAMLMDGRLHLATESFAFADAAHALEQMAMGRIRGRGVLLPVNERSFVQQ